MTIQNYSFPLRTFAATRLVVSSVLALGLLVPQTAWAGLDTTQSNTSGSIPINALIWANYEKRLEDYLRNQGFLGPLVPIDKLPGNLPAAAQKFAQAVALLNGNSPSSNLEGVGNRVATLFAPGQPNGVTPEQMRAFTSALSQAVSDLGALQTHLTKLFPQNGVIDVDEVDSVIMATTRSRKSLLALIKVLQTFPSEGTPAQAAAMADLVGILTNASSALEQAVPASNSFVTILAGWLPN